MNCNTLHQLFLIIYYYHSLDKKQEPEVLYERKEQYTLEDLIGLCTRLNNKNEENKNKWIHFDIAGPAYVEKAWGYNPYGASGTGVRTTIKLLQNLL